MSTSPVLLFPYILATSLLSILLLFTKTSEKSRFQRWTTIALLLIPILYFYFIIFSQTVRIAFIDDYNLLDSFYKMLYAPQPGERFKALFEQVNEHRFAFERVIMYLIYLVKGQPDIKIQIITGNLFLLGILFLFYRFFRHTKLPLRYFIPVPLMLFSLLYYENAIWGIAAIQNTPLLFFSLLVAYGLSRESRSGDFTAFLAAVTISFTSGSGVAVWIIGGIAYLLQKKYRAFFLWLLVAAVTMGFYFTFDYHLHPKDLSNLYKHPIYNFIYATSFWGTIFLGDYTHFSYQQYYIDLLLCFMMGCVLLGISVWWLLQTLLRQNDRQRQVYVFLAAAMLFFLATGLMLVVSRPVGTNIIQGAEIYSRRYVIFSVGLAICCYLAVLYRLRKETVLRKIAGRTALLLATMLNIGAYYFFLPNIFRHTAELKLDPYYISTRDSVLISFGELYSERLFWNHPTAFKDLLKRLDETGLYTTQNDKLAPLLRSLTMQARPEETVQGAPAWNVKLFTRPEPGMNPGINEIMTLKVSKPENIAGTPVYLLLDSGNDLFILPALADISGFRELIKTRQYFSDRYGYAFWRTKYPATRYEVRVVVADAQGRHRIIDTQQAIQL